MLELALAPVAFFLWGMVGRLRGVWQVVELELALAPVAFFFVGDVVHCPALGRGKRQVAFDGWFVEVSLLKKA